MNIFKHSDIDIENVYKENIQIGEPVLSFKDKGIYTKLFNSGIKRVGLSVRNITEFKDYVIGSKSSNVTYSLLKVVKDENNNTYITTTYPFLYLKNITGFNIDENTLENSYLKVESVNEVINSERKNYNLNELGDVVTAINKTDTNNNFVLTSTSGTYTPNKDPFKTTYYSTWSLKPEASQIKAFDNVTYVASQPYNVFRNFLSIDQNPKLLTNQPLSIYWDTNPTLSSNLNCNSLSIVYIKYASCFITTDTEVATITCDYDTYSTYTIECTDTNLLNINIKYTFDLDNLGIKLGSLIINNFKGILKFNTKVEYENGIAPVYEGDCNLFNLLIYQDSSSIITKVLHRGVNFKNV